jgi:hypothetical protein
LQRFGINTNYSEMKRLSLIAIIISALLFAGHDLQIKLYQNPDALIYGDVISYYQILPAVFVEHDLKFSFLDHENIPEKKYWLIDLGNGNRISKVTMGMAFMYLPFFVPSHYIQVALGLPSHGFSAYDKIALLLASIFYTVLALVMLRNLLLRRFSDQVVALTILIIALGTNLFYYVTVDGLMSHSFSFFLITGMIYFTDRFFRKPGLIGVLILGIILGMIVLIRPTNIFVLIFPLLWGVTSFNELKERVLFWLSSWKYILFALLGFIIVWLPQILYWKYITGQFYYNGYGDEGVKFFFNNPQVINSFFSYRKGWLLYTPVMSFAIIGLVFLWRAYKESFWAIFMYFIVSVYVISSWWLWWYGGGYGLRAYVDIYGAMAFPLAAFIAFVFEKRHFILKSLIIFIAFIFIAHNLFQVRQIYFGSIHFSDMTKEAYWESFGVLKPSLRLNALLVPLDYKSAAKGQYPKPVVQVKTSEDWIKYYEKNISRDSVYMELISKKAIERGVSIDKALYDDAKWCYENDLEQHKKTKRFLIF